jgi:membrane-associated phospholipid phosphatase
MPSRWKDSTLMSRPRHNGPDSEVTQPYGYQPPGQETAAPAGGIAAGGHPGRGRLLTGLGLCVAVLVLGEVAKSGPVARLDLRAVEHIAAHDRTSALTSLAKLATDIGKPETVGLGLMILVPVILFLLRRRLDAVKVFFIFGGAFALAEVAKKIVSEPRPPAVLQAVAADHSGSFPSGHATAAATLCVALLVIAVTVAGRVTALVLGGLYAVAVAVSRFYLGDHYPLDVIGSLFCAVAAAFVVTGLAALPALQPYLRRLEPATTGRRQRGRPA